MRKVDPSRDECACAPPLTAVITPPVTRILAGTGNVQAVHARAMGAEFVHVEISDRVRDDAQSSAELVRVLAGVVDEFASST